MAVCTQCGAQYQDGSRFCTVCGAAQPTRPAPQPSQSYSSAAIDVPPPPGSKYELISTPGFIGIMLLMGIPVVGPVLMLVWAFGGCRKLQKRNLARASLIIMLVVMLLTALMGFLVKKAVETAIERSGITEQLDALRDEKTGELDLNALSGLFGEESDLGELAELFAQFQEMDPAEMEKLMEEMSQLQESGGIPST